MVLNICSYNFHELFLSSIFKQTTLISRKKYVYLISLLWLNLALSCIILKNGQNILPCEHRMKRVNVDFLQDIQVTVFLWSIFLCYKNFFWKYLKVFPTLRWEEHKQHNEKSNYLTKQKQIGLRITLFQGKQN